MKLENIPDKIKTTLINDLNVNKKTFTEEATYALDIWNNDKNSYLRKATKQSFYNAIFNIHKIGLTLNPVKKEAYLVPRRNGDNVEISLEPSYIGLIKLLTDAGVVKNIQTNVVYEGDIFNQFFDINGVNFNHTPYYINGNEKGNIKGVYCLAFLTNGNSQFEHMTIEEINNIKEKSESYKAFKDPNKKVFTCVWNDYESEMIRKTILRRIYKYLPKSVGKQSDYIDNAVKLDESAFSASGEQIQMIENLLYTSILPESEKTQIESEYVTMTSVDAKKCINHLELNQIPPEENQNLSQENITEILQKRIDLDS
jgi:recombination protein RecT